MLFPFFYYNVFEWTHTQYGNLMLKHWFVSFCFLIEILFKRSYSSIFLLSMIEKKEMQKVYITAFTAQCDTASVWKNGEEQYGFWRGKMRTLIIPKVLCRPQDFLEREKTICGYSIVMSSSQRLIFFSFFPKPTICWILIKLVRWSTICKSICKITKIV